MITATAGNPVIVIASPTFARTNATLIVGFVVAIYRQSGYTGHCKEDDTTASFPKVRYPRIQPVCLPILYHVSAAITLSQKTV